MLCSREAYRIVVARQYCGYPFVKGRFAHDSGQVTSNVSHKHNEQVPPPLPHARDLLKQLDQRVTLTAYQKRILLWTGKYKRLEDIPDRINPSQLRNASSRVAFFAFLVGLFTYFGCVIIFQTNHSRRHWANEYDAMQRREAEYKLTMALDVQKEAALRKAMDLKTAALSK